MICLAISTVLIVIATIVYPGGSLFDQNAIGFDWSKNFFSNLFEARAINGSENSSQPWALAGIAFQSLAYGIFFLKMSKKMPSKGSSKVLNLVGLVNIVFTFLIATPLHDLMVILSGSLFLLGLFYITVHLLKTKLHFFKFASIVSLALFYLTMFLYGYGDWGLLAIIQKVSIICSMFLVLGLDYFTKHEDFLESSLKLEKSN